jgi:hypothetical protein
MTTRGQINKPRTGLWARQDTPHGRFKAAKKTGGPLAPDANDDT